MDKVDRWITEIKNFLSTKRCPTCGGTCDLQVDWGTGLTTGERDFANVPYEVYVVCAHPNCPQNQTKYVPALEECPQYQGTFPKGLVVSSFWPHGGYTVYGARPTGSKYSGTARW